MFEHHLSMVMALSPSPSNLHLYLLRQPQAHYSNTFRALKFNCSCSLHSVQVDTQQVRVPLKTTKVKRKPRPSFFEQIRDKWSLKINSPREKFPWQEKGEETRNDSGVVAPDSEVVDSSVASPVSSTSESHFVSVPCLHETKHRKPWMDSEPEIPQHFSSEQGENVVGFGSHLASVDEWSKNPQNEVDPDGEFEGESVEVDETPIGVLGNEKIKFEMGYTSVSLGEKPFVGDEEIQNLEGFSGNNSSIALPWKRQGGVEPVERDGRGRSKTRMSERMVPEHELRRLKNVALRMQERIKVGPAGVTQSLLDTIHEKWKIDEVVKLKFEGPPSYNMKRTHEILEVSVSTLCYCVLPNSADRIGSRIW